MNVLFQDDDGSKVEKPRISETRTEHGPKTLTCELKCQEPFYKPAKRADLSSDYMTETHPVDQDLLQAMRTKDLVWSLARLDLSENRTQINVKPSDQTMPVWRETNAVLSEKDISKKKVGFLPVLPYPVAQNDTVYNALNNFKGIINQSQKSASGIIGNTRKKKFMAMWEIYYHEMLAISNLFRELCGISSNVSEEHIISEAEIATGEKKVQAIIATIERNENPFQFVPGQVKLHNILTQEVMPDDIRSQLLSVIEIGTKAYETLRKERFVEKSVRFSSTIHRTNLKTFLGIHKDEKENKGKSSGKKKEDTQMRCSTEIARARGRTMQELFQNDVSSTSYLFVEDLMMTKPQKSALVQDLETILTNDDERVPAIDSELQAASIADVMANIRKIKAKDIKTFGNFCEQFLDYISAICRGPDRLDLVFDSFIEGSIKASERIRCQDKAPIEMNSIHYDTPLPIEMDKFWPSSNNKVKL